MCWYFLNHCPPVKVVCIQILKICILFIRIVLISLLLIISHGIDFHCLSNSNLNTFFKHLSMSLSSSGLNSSWHSSKSLRFGSWSQYSEAVFNKAYHAKLLCKNVLDLTCSALSTYFERSQNTSTSSKRSAFKYVSW